ncbi:hypothetical protein ABPG75_001388 [Micractinium tetrahymenae]
MALLVNDAYERIAEPAWVLEHLADPGRQGLQCVREICSSAFSIQTRNDRKAVSLQRAVVPLLRLVTAPQLLNHCMGGMVNVLLAQVADSLSLCRLADCLQQLPSRGHISDLSYTKGSQGSGPLTPTTWFDRSRLPTTCTRCAPSSGSSGWHRQTASPPAWRPCSALQMPWGQSSGSSTASSPAASETSPAFWSRTGSRRSGWSVLSSCAVAGERRRRTGRACLVARRGPACCWRGLGSSALLVPGTTTTTPTSMPLRWCLPNRRRSARWRPTCRKTGLAAWCTCQRPAARRTSTCTAGSSGTMCSTPCSRASPPTQPHPSRRQPAAGAGAASPGVAATCACLCTPMQRWWACRPPSKQAWLSRWSLMTWLVGARRASAATSGRRRAAWSTARWCACCCPAAACCSAPFPTEMWPSWLRRPASAPVSDSACTPGTTMSLKQLLDLLVPPADGSAASGGGGSGRAGAQRGHLPAQRFVMLQASGSWFAYEPFLRALQGQAELPLRESLLAMPSGPSGAGTAAVEVPPPQYLQAGGSTHIWDLAMLEAKDRLAALPPAEAARHRAALRSVDLLRAEAFPLAALRAATTLDDAQIAALQAALTKSVALIQGPPGTGKTYLGTRILEDRAPPILCVCLTNHALDQFLEGLLDAGIDSIIRVGGRSRSERLKAFNLRELAYRAPAAGQKSERRLLAAQFEQLDHLRRSIPEAAAQLQRMRGQGLSWRDVELLLAQQSPGLHASILRRAAPEGEDEEGWQVAARTRDQVWKWWASGKDGMAAGQGGLFNVLAGLGEDALGEGWQLVAAGQAQQGSLHALLAAQAERQEACKPGLGLIWSPARPPELEWELADAPEHDTQEKDLRQERRRLLGHWLSMLTEDLQEQLATDARRFTKEVSEIHQSRDLELLRSAAVVGMTTAGVASKQQLIRALGSKARGAGILVVEEAAEVLEAQIIACLTSSTEHVILIGDHEQLRPKLQTYALSMDSGKGFNLDLSLFERLVRQQSFPVFSLAQQHRMRPDISRLIRATIYPHLQARRTRDEGWCSLCLDHPRVGEYPHVKGMKHDVFWVTHNEPEGGDSQESASKFNLFEAHYAIWLARYLVQQGYSQSNITVLTPYVGQLQHLRQLAGKHLDIVVDDRDAAELAGAEGGSGEGPDGPPDSPRSTGGGSGGEEMGPQKAAVRLATIDNYQGEEASLSADIIILSLVRSNPNNVIGFLKLPNRVNVLLSRARQGMYIIANHACLLGSRNAGIWPKVVEMLDGDGLVGPTLQLACQKHPEHQTTIAHWRDFALHASDGGCHLSCDQRLGCGHACPRQAGKCHSNDPGHRLARCMKPCLRMHEGCGHPCARLCWQECGPCCVVVPKTVLPCGHVAKDLPCHRATSPDSVACPERQPFKLPHCGHEVQTTCSEAAKLAVQPWRCTKPCSALLGCGHACGASCGACMELWLGQQLGLQALNSRVPALGSLQTRQEGSTLEGSCPLPCGAPCCRLPCDRRCERRLSCGCRCPSICGEPCPSREFCIHCGSDKIKPSALVLAAGNPAVCLPPCLPAEEEVDEDPLVLLPCKHGFTLSFMDGHMCLAEAYDAGSDGAWTEPLPLKREMAARKTCMLCRQPLPQIFRYGRVLNKHVMDTAQKKFAQHTSARLQALHTELRAYAEAVQAARGGAGGQPTTLLQRGQQLLGTRCQLVAFASKPPSQDVYSKSRASLLRAAEERGLDAAAVEDALRHLVMPQPDVAPVMEACLGHVQVRMAVCQGAIRACQAAAARPAPRAAAARAAATATEPSTAGHERLRGLAAAVEAEQGAALSDVRLLEDMAERRGLPCKLVSAHHLHAQLLLTQALSLEGRRSAALSAALGVQHSTHVSQLASRRQELLQQAEEACRAALAAAAPRQGQQQLEGLREQAAEVARLLARIDKVKQQKEGITPEELREVFQAMTAADPTLGSAWSWNNAGHWFSCSCGHIYSIGECGGATQQARCPECGATIGGSSHTLAAGNRSATEFLQAVQGGLGAGH